jgi:hypothetical protein
VPLAATAGQSAGYIVTEIVPLLRNNSRIVLYIGDHELRGPADQIEANTRAYIEKHANRKFGPNEWTKIALTADQVNEDSDAGRRLRDLAIEKTDKRYKKGGKKYTAVECEAFGQAEIVNLIRDLFDAMRRRYGLEPIEDVDT